MQSKLICHNNMCVSTTATVHIHQSKHINSKETLMSHPFVIAKESGVIPASVFFDQAKDAVKQLQLLNTHPGDATLIGFLPDQVAALELVMVRTDRKQKDWTEIELPAITEMEAAVTHAALDRMRPAIKKARKNSLSAEELMQALTGEPDMKIARERFLTQSGQSVSIRDNENVLALPNAAALPKRYLAKEPYTFTVAVESTDRVASSVRLLLVDKLPPEELFLEHDVGVRTIITSVKDSSDIKLLALCMANQVSVHVKVALSITIGGSGLSYTANLISILNPALALATVKQVMTADSNELF